MELVEILTIGFSTFLAEFGSPDYEKNIVDHLSVQTNYHYRYIGEI